MVPKDITENRILYEARRSETGIRKRNRGVMNRDKSDSDELNPVPGQFQYHLLRTTATPEEIVPQFADSQVDVLIRLNFTRVARNIMLRARMATLCWKASGVSVEHVLLGILQWVPLRSFIANGPESEVITQAVEAGLNPGTDPRPDILPITPAVRHVIEEAEREAQDRGYRRVGVGPLLLAISLESDSSAQACLTRYGITHERLRSSLPPSAFSD